MSLYSHDPETDAELSAIAETRAAERERKAETPCLIYDDPREIEGIFGEIGSWFTAAGQTIAAYREHGQCDWVPYYAVSQNGEIVARIPAHLVAVTYIRTEQPDV